VIRATILVSLILALAAGAPGARKSAPDAHFTLPRDTFLIDESIPIVVSGLSPRAVVTIRARGGAQQAPWTSSAVFTADESGTIDLSRMAPAKAEYTGVEPMGLFWTAKRERGGAAPDIDDDDIPGATWMLSAETGGAVIARATIKRYAVDLAVRISDVRENGLVGSFYEPPDAGRHPALLVLTGSGGGFPPVTGPAGGLASRGYAVLALAYFNAGRLPPTLSNIPLEYFGTALEWLSRQPSVDPNRIGVLGGSRGGELALLLGALYPGIHAVVAYVPSNVVWPGCCDRFSPVAWTLGGRPLAAVPLGGMRIGPQALRAEIPVEKINGPVLLISGNDDGVWDSTPMSKRIVSRLERNHFPFAAEHLAYEHAGHAIGRPYTSTMNLSGVRHPISGRLMRFGGTPAGTAHAREDSWRHMLSFLDEHLAHRKSSTIPH
jgi:dienelactone hydrolase